MIGWQVSLSTVPRGVHAAAAGAAPQPRGGGAECAAARGHEGSRVDPAQPGTREQVGGAIGAREQVGGAIGAREQVGGAIGARKQVGGAIGMECTYYLCYARYIHEAIA